MAEEQKFNLARLLNDKKVNTRDLNRAYMVRFLIAAPKWRAFLFNQAKVPQERWTSKVVSTLGLMRWFYDPK